MCQHRSINTHPRVCPGRNACHRADHNKPGPAPQVREDSTCAELRNVTQWINSEPLSMKKLRGKVVLVHFWTNGCFNCKNNYPHYKAWQERYAGKDVVILGIHTPETIGERDIERIEKQAEKNGLKFPIAVDNEWRELECLEQSRLADSLRGRSARHRPLRMGGRVKLQGRARRGEGSEARRRAVT